MLIYLAISPRILYWNFSSSVMIWNLRLDEISTGVGDGDLLERDEWIMNWKRYNSVDVPCSCDVYVLFFFCWVTLIYLKMMMMMMMSCFLSTSAFPSSLVTWERCVKSQLPHCPEGCLTKIPLSWVESFFLSLLLPAIICYKQ